MSDEQGQVPNPTDNGQEPAGETESAQLDAEALMKEVRSLRKEAASWRTKFRDLEQAEEERRRSEMTEVERLRADLDAERQARQQAEQQRQQETLRHQVMVEASKLGFVDPSDVIALLPSDSIELKPDGSISGLTAALKKLAEEKPYLTKASTPAISPTHPAGGQPPSYEQLKQDIFGRKAHPIFQGGGVVWPER